VADRRFRADLYYRLQVLTLTLPPLRARPDEILPMAHSFLPKGASLTRSAQDALTAYRWPGNIRELKNTLWRAAILAGTSPIDVVHLGLPGDIPAPPTGRNAAQPRTLEDAEREAIRVALAAVHGNRSAAAKTLGIARSTLLEKLKRYGLE
jgi:DNA-binding NtrC family response regulator